MQFCTEKHFKHLVSWFLSYRVSFRTLTFSCVIWSLTWISVFSLCFLTASAATCSGICGSPCDAWTWTWTSATSWAGSDSRCAPAASAWRLYRPRCCRCPPPPPDPGLRSCLWSPACSSPHWNSCQQIILIRIFRLILNGLYEVEINLKTIVNC